MGTIWGQPLIIDVSQLSRADPNTQRCRDTFTSLKKTCQKLSVSFWDYLIDRLSNANIIPPLPELIFQYANAP